MEQLRYPGGLDTLLPAARWGSSSLFITQAWELHVEGSAARQDCLSGGPRAAGCVFLLYAELSVWMWLWVPCPVQPLIFSGESFLGVICLVFQGLIWCSVCNVPPFSVPLHLETCLTCILH